MNHSLREEVFAARAEGATHDGHPLERLNSRVLAIDFTRHEADDNLALEELLTGRPEPSGQAPRIELDRQSAAAAAAPVLERLGIPDDARLVILHAGSTRPSRR